MENEKETSAKTLSKNKIKKISEKQYLVKDESKNSNFFENHDIFKIPLSRGLYDLVSLNLRYINSKTFNRYYPLSEEEKNILRLFILLIHLVFGPDVFYSHYCPFVC